MVRFSGSIVQYPARVSLGWYLAFIGVGTLLLMLPACRVDQAAPLGWIDAVFAATSATCVTGLTVRSTGFTFSIWGQLVILLLIQLGGIGIMTVTTYATFRFGRRADLHQRALLADTLGAEATMDLRWVLRNVLRTTLLFESIGFIALAIRFKMDQPLGEALWSAAFHSISAFCNAGFALYDDSLTRYQDDWLVNGIIMLLIVIGGIGFPVLLDLKRKWRGSWRDCWERLALHSKVMLIGTGSLLLLGFVVTYALEYDGVLDGMPWWQKILVSMFYSVTTRTAGFNTVDTASLTNATLFFTVVLMAIGAGPCSAAGGFKVSTFSILVLRAWATFRGRVQVNVFRRTVAASVVERAMATAMLFLVVGVLALTTIVFLEQSALPHIEGESTFLDALFEITSALGTVGLSTGLTTRLSEPGRLILVLLMFMGRLGPISVSLALSSGQRKKLVEYPQEDALIG
jgi:trk system potassium uptake protein TrkH